MKLFKEDRLLDSALEVISVHHEMIDPVVKRHVRVNGFEIDALVFYRTPGGHMRRMVIELKENDVGKVIFQVIRRRFLGHYAYAVINLKPYEIMTTLLSQNLIRAVMDYDIGVVSFFEGKPLLLIKGKYRKPKLPIILDYI